VQIGIAHASPANSITARPVTGINRGPRMLPKYPSGPRTARLRHHLGRDVWRATSLPTPDEDAECEYRSRPSRGQSPITSIHTLRSVPGFSSEASAMDCITPQPTVYEYGNRIAKGGDVRPKQPLVKDDAVEKPSLTPLHQ